MRYYVTIDTNVLVSALLSPSSVPGKIAEEAMKGSIIPLYNDAILAEYDEVLHRRKFRFDRDVIKLRMWFSTRSRWKNARPMTLTSSLGI